MVTSDNHSNLLGQFLSYEENGVLWIQKQGPQIYIDLHYIMFQIKRWQNRRWPTRQWQCSRSPSPRLLFRQHELSLKSRIKQKAFLLSPLLFRQPHLPSKLKRKQKTFLKLLLLIRQRHLLLKQRIRLKAYLPHFSLRVGKLIHIKVILVGATSPPILLAEQMGCILT